MSWTAYCHEAVGTCVRPFLRTYVLSFRPYVRPPRKSPGRNCLTGNRHFYQTRASWQKKCDQQFTLISFTFDFKFELAKKRLNLKASLFLFVFHTLATNGWSSNFCKMFCPWSSFSRTNVRLKFRRFAVTQKRLAEEQLISEYLCTLARKLT